MKGHPIAYGGSGDSGAHTFILEGVNLLATYYKINFGWSGTHNGWYSLDDITPESYAFNNSQDALFDLKPNNTTYRDRYEPDNTQSQTSYIMTQRSYGVDKSNKGYSINPKSDVDYTQFRNDTEGPITIETLNSSGDTEMWLYDSSGNEIAYNDDGGSGLLSKITVNLNAAAFYYIKVSSYKNRSIINSYDLKVTW